MNNILRFRSPEPVVEARPVPVPNLPPKLHPKVKWRRLTWLVLMILFISWAIFQLIVQQIHIWDRETQLHKSQQELATTQATTKQLENELKRYRDHDFLMELAHKHGYGKPGEKNFQVGNE